MAILRVMGLTIGVFLGPAMAAGAEFSSAAPPGLGFQAEGPGLYTFDTGLLRGRLKMDGRYQGLYPIVEKAGGAELTMPPGLLSPYRVFSRGVRYGDAARDWPTSTTLRPDGAVEVYWPARPEHPLEMKALYRWIQRGCMDFELQVTPQKEMLDFELFLSSYLTKGFRAAVYVRPGKQEAKPTQQKLSAEGAGSDFQGGTRTGQKRGQFVWVDRPPEAKSGYVMYPRDEKALRMIQDGRWKIPPSPVDWDIGPFLANPICLRRDLDLGITVVLMAPPEDCFAVSSAWNPATPQAGGYRSLYLSLFGRDLKAGQSSTARCRLVIGRDLTDAQILEIYEKYTNQTK